MKHYGVASWKPTCLWSNSFHVKDLDLGSLTPAMKANSVPLAMTYRDARGVKRCVGKKKTLKESQILDCTRLPHSGPLSIVLKFLQLWSKHKNTLHHFFQKKMMCVSLVCFSSWSSKGLHQSLWVQDRQYLLQDAWWSLGFAEITGLSVITIFLQLIEFGWAGKIFGHVCIHVHVYCLQSQKWQDQNNDMTLNDILASMISSTYDAWDDADMRSVLFYLRGNKHLNVPPAFREILGMNKWGKGAPI